MKMLVLFYKRRFTNKYIYESIIISMGITKMEIDD